MKKILSLFAAVLFAGSMMAATVMTCAEAREAALSVSANNELYNNGEEIEVTAYVTNIAYALKDGSMSFWMADAADGGNVLEAYKCAIADAADAPVVGDKVKVTGNLTKYNTTPEFAPNCTCEILERAGAPENLGPKTIAEFLELKNAKDTCILRGAVANIVMDKTDPTKYNAYGNFDLVDATGSLYIYGLLTPEGEAQKFIEMGINEGDSITVKALYAEYNGDPQAKNAILVEGGSVVPVEEADVVFTSADFNGQGTSGTGSEVTATKDGVTFTCDMAYGDQYGVRCYKNGVVTISSTDQQIGKIVFEFATVSGKYYNGDLDEEIVVNANEWTATLTNQARMNKISIYFGEFTPVVVEIDTVTVAQAVEIGMALEDNATTEKDYVVAGWVVQAYAPNEGYTDQTWFMADEAGAYGEFEAYRCTPDYLVENDQFVYVKGKIQKFVKDSKVQIEIGKGTATHLYGQGIENVVLTEKVQKVVVDGVIYIIRDNKMFNVQGTQVR